VLYAPFSWEVPEHCISSVIQMRHFLTAELSASGLGDELGGTLRAMRAACRKFLNSVGAPDDPRKRVRSTRTPPSAWDLNSALGELRGVFGIHLARLAVQYGLDIEHELVTILPAPPDETDA